MDNEITTGGMDDDLRTFLRLGWPLDDDITTLDDDPTQVRMWAHHVPTEFPRYHIPDDIPVIALTALRSLIVDVGQCDPVGHLPISCLLSVLNVPSLGCLSVDMDSPSTTRWESVSSLQLGDPPPLRDLTLHNLNLEGSFVDFVSRLCRLECLNIVHCEVKAEGLLAFIPHDNMVCPRLAALSFNNTIIPGDLLVKVVQSRTPLPENSLDRCLCSVSVIECAGTADHLITLKGIMEACGGRWASTLYDGDCLSTSQEVNWKLIDIL